MVLKIIHFIILKLEFNLLLLLLLLYTNSLLSHHVIVVVVGGGVVSRTDVNYFPFGQTVPRLCGYVMFEKIYHIICTKKIKDMLINAGMET